MPTYDRSRSILQMTSPLGPDVLIPTAISGYEAISQPFSYRVQIVSTEQNITPDRVLHQPGCVILRRDDDPARYFHGIFQEFAAAGQVRAGAQAGQGMFAYHAVLVPGYWFLSQTIDCRVFQDMSVVQIIQQMLNDAGITASDFRLYSVPPKRHYTVQFNETDLQFATRLMEESGLFYFFEHSADQHTFVVADNNNAFHPIADAVLRFDANIRAEDVLTAWHVPQATTHGKATLKDYDPTNPNQVLQNTRIGDQNAIGGLKRDVFLWPAATHKPNDVQDRTNFMIQAADAANAVVSGAGAFRPLAAGAQFTLQQDPVTQQQGASQVVRWMSFEAVDESWSTDGAPAFYANSFECFPATVPWRQPLSVARPDMGSIHSAVVLGPDGEEIYTDEYGRVKVRFFWDWRSEANAGQSVWARVVQPWAGNGWGAQFIPRVGMEVAVAFIDGDADRPVVLGGLYNGNQMPIYPLAQKTKSGLRTRSSLGGGTDDFNELTFDDNNGQEMVFLQAQKDLSTNVKHDQTLTVGNNRTVKVGQAENITIGNGRTAQVSQGDDTLTVQQGDLSIAIVQGKATITAMQSIELKVGSSSILIDQTGITISGTLISINGTASLSAGAPLVSVNADANLSLQGGLVEIN